MSPTLLRFMENLTNEEMFLEAFMYYKEHKKEIQGAKDVAAHHQSERMRIR
jgi:hypothetical protein